jgi:glycosyltransferase involved in cell wall biosynthesis
MYLWSPGDFEGMTFAVNLLPRLLADKPEVVLNFGGTASSRICRMLRHLRGTPFLHSAQGMAQGRLELIHASRRPDRYLATSLPNKEWIEARAPWLKTRLLPNGVDCSLFTPDGEVASVPLPPPIVLFVGAIDPVKRPDLTIQAVARLNQDSDKNGKGVSLLMIGDGRTRSRIEKLGKELLGERFHLFPSIPHEQLPAYFRASSIFTLASPAEPFGIVFVEAMACNRAAVAHRVEVQKWLIGEAGICCDCENAEEYAAALRRALDTDYGDRPRRQARQFEWADIVREYESVFSEVVEERSRAKRGLERV